MIRAAIFDMDGLLIDSEPLWSRAFKKAFKDAVNVRITDQDMIEIMGFRQIESVAYLYDKHGVKGYPAEDMEKLIQEDMVALIKNEGVLLPGVHQALQICKKAKLNVAIASSSPMILINAVVETLEIREHFDHIYSAQFEPYGKPHPGVFIKVAEHFKARPQECLVFEDSPAGVLAAKAAKMKCVAVPEPDVRDNPFVKTADAILDSLEGFDEAMLAGF